ncbi:type II toxin-antitoxin system prevent-host-death family antitoxin [Lacihabitans sp. CCS-44]|uniref:type II toxin-antitoxin system Phd/YefM family antitoxin n=1 Tax=Lacihabitans sp. CCS-44 TaxID=2487331 RepID=UPI0020CC5AA2|nr:type II toxin-antitoxin system prevent-host-death family antitoxin [Lacihabitans sp. CCS-44]MCP9754034.1 type II toxin-antitoxin system prevent-host-death family antitoxin [Lacihabitans sp. CCS-44]
METVNIHDAKSQLSALINKVLNGEKIIIARNNQPVVELVALKKQKRVPGQLTGKIKVLGTWEESDVAVSELFDNNEIFRNEKNTN